MSQSGGQPSVVAGTLADLQAYDGAAWQNVRGVSPAADGEALALFRLLAEAALFGYNGATLDRIRTGIANADPNAAGLLATMLAASDGAAFRRLLTVSGIAADAVTGANMLGSGLWGYNGATYDRLRTLAAAGNGLGALATDIAASGATATKPSRSDHGAATVASAVVKAAAGVLYNIRGLNKNAAVRMLQIFDAAAVPADATVPLMEAAMAATGGVGFIDFGVRGMPFTTGLSICISTTAGTKTLAGADLEYVALYV